MKQTSCYFFSYVFINYGNVYFLAVSIHNTNAMLLVTYLYRLGDVLRDYLKSVDEESVKDNFVIIYELLDEMMDNGIPQLSDSKILKEYIKTESNRLLSAAMAFVDQARMKDPKEIRPPTAITNAVSWRKEGIKYKK